MKRGIEGASGDDGLPHIFSQVGMSTPLHVPKPPLVDGLGSPPRSRCSTLYHKRSPLAAGPLLTLARAPSSDSDEDALAVTRVGTHPHAELLGPIDIGAGPVSSSRLLTIPRKQAIVLQSFSTASPKQHLLSLRRQSVPTHHLHIRDAITSLARSFLLPAS